MINTGRNWIRGNRTKSGSGTKAEMDLQKACAGFTKALGTILKIGINEIGGGSLANAGNRLFSSIEILIWKMKV